MPQKSEKNNFFESRLDEAKSKFEIEEANRETIGRAIEIFKDFLLSRFRELIQNSKEYRETEKLLLSEDLLSVVKAIYECAQTDMSDEIFRVNPTDRFKFVLMQGNWIDSRISKLIKYEQKEDLARIGLRLTEQEVIDFFLNSYDWESDLLKMIGSTSAVIGMGSRVRIEIFLSGKVHAEWMISKLKGEDAITIERWQGMDTFTYELRGYSSKFKSLEEFYEYVVKQMAKLKR